MEKGGGRGREFLLPVAGGGGFFEGRFGIHQRIPVGVSLIGSGGVP
jgi:hypothetical protein